MAANTLESGNCTDNVKKAPAETDSSTLKADIHPQDQREVFGAPKSAAPSAVKERESALNGSLDFAAQGDIYTGAIAGAVAGAAANAAAASADNARAAATDEVRHVRQADEPVVNPDSFAASGKKVLAKLDTAHKGEVTKEQLAQALQNPAMKGDESQAVAGMYKKFDQLHNLSRHEWIWSTATITPADLDKFDTMAKETMNNSRETVTMKTWADENLKKFSTYGGDYLTRSDVKRALDKPDIAPADKAALELIQKHWGEMSSWTSFIGLSKKDFADLDNKVYSSGNGKVVVDVYGACSGVATEGQKAGVCYDLYSDKDPLKSIDPSGVRQGSIGDCYFESVVASVAKNNPQSIHDAIKDNKDGTYTVTFPGAKGEPQTVKAPTEAELGIYNHGSKNGVWASVMEKAYGQYRQSHDKPRTGSPQEGADGGGYCEPVIKLLTGSDATNIRVGSAKSADLAKQLESAFSANPRKIVAAGTFNELSPNPSPLTADKFYRGHAYSITAFTPDGKGGGNVTIRNPWGGTDNTPDGTIEVPMDKFMSNFGDVSIQK